MEPRYEILFQKYKKVIIINFKSISETKKTAGLA